MVKLIDSATTALMSALATNDEIKEAKLTMRKPGSEQMDYFLVTLKNARVSAIDHATDAQGNTLRDGDLAVHQGRGRIPAAEEHGRRGGSSRSRRTDPALSSA